jgi:hypothetical protein
VFENTPTSEKAVEFPLTTPTWLKSALDPPRRSIWNPSSTPEVSCQIKFTCEGDDPVATKPVGAVGAGLGTAAVHPICATVNGQSANSFKRIMHSVEL